MGTNERRASARHAVELAVELRRGGNMVMLKTADLSSGGVYFDRAIPHEVGTKVKVRLDLPGDPAPVLCEGVVVSRRQGELGMGVKFVNLSDGDQARVARFADALPDADPDGAPHGS